MKKEQTFDYDVVLERLAGSPIPPVEKDHLVTLRRSYEMVLSPFVISEMDLSPLTVYRPFLSFTRLPVSC